MPRFHVNAFTGAGYSGWLWCGMHGFVRNGGGGEIQGCVVGRAEDAQGGRQVAHQRMEFTFDLSGSFAANVPASNRGLPPSHSCFRSSTYPDCIT